MFKGSLFYRLENVLFNMGPALRGWGQKAFRDGNALQGASGHIDKMQPSLRCVPIASGAFPKSLDSDWIAPNAVLIGDVTMGEGSSAWHGSVLRGDTAKITVGKNSVLQDNTRVASNSSDAAEVAIGDNVFVGANAKLDGCTLKSYSYVGMGASVGEGASVESFGVLAAGAFLEPGQTVPEGQVYAGAPARYLRDVTQQEKHIIGEHHLEMQ